MPGSLLRSCEIEEGGRKGKETQTVGGTQEGREGRKTGVEGERGEGVRVRVREVGKEEGKGGEGMMSSSKRGREEERKGGREGGREGRWVYCIECVLFD